MAIAYLGTNQIGGAGGGGEVNVIETVKVNGTALSITNKAVDVPVPTKVSDLTNDSGFTTNTGTVTSVTLSSGTGITVSNSGTAITTSGSRTISLSSTYAGGTAVTLNNSSKAGSTASFYAPTTGGASNKVLIGNGTTSAPTWSGFTLTGTTNTAYDLATISSNASNGNTAYGWGNHANAGYVTSSALSGYVKLDASTGQTMTTSSINPILIFDSSSSQNDVALAFSINGTRVAGIGFEGTPSGLSGGIGAFFSVRVPNTTTSYRISLGTDGTLKYDDNIVYHSGNFVAGTNYVAPGALANYLPLTGGTISNMNVYSLYLNNSSSGATGVGLRFQVGGTTVGGLVAGSDNSLSYVSGTSTFNTVYHSGNSNKSDVAWACSTLTASGKATFSDEIYLANAKYIRSYGGDNETIYNIIGMNPNNALLIGYGIRSLSGAVTRIYGETMYLYHSDSTTENYAKLTPGAVELVGSSTGPSLTFVGTSTPNATGGSLYFYSRAQKYNGFRISSLGGQTYDRASLVFYISNQASNASPSWTQAMRIHYNGNIKIGTGTPSEALDVTGNITATGTITPGGSSDERLKTNIKTMTGAYAKNIILNANPVTFTWNELATSLYDGYTGDDIGLVSQQVQPLVPSAIGTIYEEYQRLDYTKFVAPLIRVAQDHEDRISALERIINQ